MILSSSVLTKPLNESQVGLGLLQGSVKPFLSTLQSSLTLSNSFCSLSVFSSRSLSLSCCAFSCFSSCFFFDSAIVLSKTGKQIVSFNKDNGSELHYSQEHKRNTFCVMVRTISHAYEFRDQAGEMAPLLPCPPMMYSGAIAHELQVKQGRQAILSIMTAVRRERERE